MQGQETRRFGGPRPEDQARRFADKTSKLEAPRWVCQTSRKARHTHFRPTWWRYRQAAANWAWSGEVQAQVWVHHYVSDRRVEGRLPLATQSGECATSTAQLSASTCAKTPPTRWTIEHTKNRGAAFVARCPSAGFHTQAPPPPTRRPSVSYLPPAWTLSALLSGTFFPLYRFLEQRPQLASFAAQGHRLYSPLWPGR